MYSDICYFYSIICYLSFFYILIKLCEKNYKDVMFGYVNKYVEMMVIGYG